MYKAAHNRKKGFQCQDFVLTSCSRASLCLILIRALQGVVNCGNPGSISPPYILLHLVLDWLPAVRAIVPPLLPQSTLSFSPARPAWSPAQIADKREAPSKT